MAFTKQNEEAVSPVIGVILMVAITVILAAVIAAFVFGMAGGIQKTKVVAVTLSRSGTGTVQALYQGGADSASLTNLTFSGTGVTTTSPCLTAACNPIAIGCRTAITTTTNPAQILVLGHFNDGSTQILLDQLI
ncbi:MAG: type IV pilin N-terminal domain-containing protein [Methanomicrobiales archaeon]